MKYNLDSKLSDFYCADHQKSNARNKKDKRWKFNFARSNNKCDRYGVSIAICTVLLSALLKNQNIIGKISKVSTVTVISHPIMTIAIGSCDSKLISFGMAAGKSPIDDIWAV
jgi:hypothetical protein